MWLFLALFASPVALQLDTCEVSPLLPAYAHNEYRNRRPLFDALALGFRGAEADVFRVGSELIVGHDSRGVAATVSAPIRVHHAPDDGRIYAWLIAEGVTLVGTNDLIRTHLLLRAGASRPPN